MPNILATQLLLCGRESNDKAVDSGLDLSPGSVVMVPLPNPDSAKYQLVLGCYLRNPRVGFL